MVRNAFKSIVGFFRLLGHAPPKETGMEAAYEAAKRIREASHVSRGGHSFNSDTDKLYGKALTQGHKRARKES